ncbi:MAG: OmpA family protein [Pseudomonadota bacterium]|nr:OmpA family protein [Pseudomonadota bacterium]
MSTQNDDNQGVVWAILIGVVLLAISLAIGMGLYRTGPSVSAAGTATGMAAQGSATGFTPAADPAAGTLLGASTNTAMNEAAAPPVGEGPSVRVEEGVVKFYFASGSAELAPGAADALADVIKGVAAGQTAVISGFHDTTGNLAQNEELAKQRAFAVRDALMALGIGEDKLSLEKPEVTTAGGPNAEARRVEVTLR